MKPLLLCAMLTLPIFGAEYYHKGELKTLTPEPAPLVQANPTSMGQISSSGTKWYRNENDQKVGVNSAILVQWKDISQAEKVLNDFSLTGAEMISETIWLVPVPKSMDIFEITKKLYEHEAVKFAQPDMINERRMR